MGFDSLDAQAQAVGNFAGGFAAHDQAQDFQLPRRQAVAVGDRRAGGLATDQRLVDHCVGDGGAQVAFVVTQGQQGMFQLVGGGVLEQVAVGAGLQCAHDQVRLGVHRQNQHLARGVKTLELLQGIQPAGVLHRQVEQHDIWLQGTVLLQ